MNFLLPQLKSIDAFLSFSTDNIKDCNEEEIFKKAKSTEAFVDNSIEEVIKAMSRSDMNAKKFINKHRISFSSDVKSTRKKGDINRSHQHSSNLKKKTNVSEKASQAKIILPNESNLASLII